MCDINLQTGLLLNTKPLINPPQFIMPLINAYAVNHNLHTLNFNVYPEPYYGDFDNCSSVLLTHNPGQAEVNKKGINSTFEAAIDVLPNTRENNYYNMATTNIFPNKGTNNWVNQKNTEINNLLNTIINFKNRLYIRDLVPYHGATFGNLPMHLCASYLYNYFFCQVICSSFNSEFYHYLNRNNPKIKTSILFARGAAWKKPDGLSSIGWDFIGRIYSNCYIFKANMNIISKIKGVNLNEWPCDITSNEIYIVVITPKKGGRVVIYKTIKNKTTDFNLSDIVFNYKNIINPNDDNYINHTIEMDDFIRKLN
jgi:hypothetical protein